MTSPSGTMPSPLTFTSCQAPIAEAFCEALVALVGRRLGVATHFVADVPWQGRERRFDAGEIQVCWMCGWPYAERADAALAQLELLAAPVMADPRYGDRPVYYSDVVVRADSRFASFAELRGACWAYNEPRSHSGYNAVRYLLASRGIRDRFFGSAVESGSHQASVDLVLRRSVDASAIDSTVLEAMRRCRPELGPLLRVIDTIGPSAAPPWVMRTSLPGSLRAALREQFLSIGACAEGEALLRQAGVQRFAAVDDRHYGGIRRMAAVGALAIF